MPFSPRIEAALDNFRRAKEAGRLPHALLVSGHPRGAGGDFAEGWLSLVFPDVDPALLRQHVDIRWVEPEGKSRQIKAIESRSLIQFFDLTSYEGGCKACVILFADRMNHTAQNILLKTLEEPPPDSYLLLVTDTAAGMLPTIRSRTQVVDVSEEGGPLHADWGPVVMDLLRNPPLRKATEMLVWTDQLTAPLRDLKERASDEEDEKAEEAEKSQIRQTNSSKEQMEGRIASRVKEMREEILRIILLWQRDVLACATGAESEPTHFPLDTASITQQAEGLSFAEAMARVTVVNTVRELLEHNIRESVALIRMARAFSMLAC